MSSTAEGEQPLMKDDTYAVGVDDFDTTPKRAKPLKSTTPLAYLHRFFRAFPVQCIMIILTFVDVSFLIYEFATLNTQFELVTLCTALCFFLEVLVMVGYYGKDIFRQGKWWVWAEIIIVTGSFIVEYIEFILHYAIEENELTTYLRYLRAVRFLRVGILWKTRWRNFTAALRRLVSADRRRYQSGGYDLDLTYVNTKVIATSWPSEGREGMYRNHINNVSAFLDEMHPDSYFVYNLCSERTYDETKFHNRVHRYKLDDHNPPELIMMHEFAQDAHEWIEKSANNVAVVHCKGGKGRTGTMTCAYLLYSKTKIGAQSALDYFGKMRTSEDAKSFQGVESPSQYRYVHYYDRLLALPNREVPQRTVRLTTFRIDHLPPMWWTRGVDKLWFAVVNHPNTTRKLRYVSNPTVTFDPQLPENPYGTPSKKRNMSVSPFMANSTATFNENESMAQPAPDFIECQPFGGNYIIYVDGDFNTPLTCDAFTNKYGAVRDGQVVPESKLDKNIRVTLEVNTSTIPPFSGDTTIKFFYNEDMPNTLRCPMQIWFHPSMEGSSIRFEKGDIDGPHKEKKKSKKFPQGLAIDVTLETTDLPDNQDSDYSPTEGRTEEDGSDHKVETVSQAESVRPSEAADVDES